MSPKNAQWYLERVNAYLKDPKLAQKKYFLAPNLLLEILKENLGVENLSEARAILEKIAAGALFEQNLPGQETLRYWQEELKKTEKQKGEINKKVVQEIRTKIEKRMAMAKRIQALLQAKSKLLAEEPEKAQDISEKISEKIEEITPERYSETLSNLHPWVSHLLQEDGVFLPPEAIQTFLEETAGTTAAEAPQKVPVLPLAGRIKPRPTIPPEESLFTPAVKEKFASEEERVALVGLYTLFQPQAAASFAKKLVLAPIIKPLQFFDLLSGDELQGETVTEWREKLHQGLSSQDLQESYATLEETGTSPEHPQMKALEGKRARMKRYEETHPKISVILKHYHEFSKITGRRQIYSPQIRAPLPRLSPSPSWFSKLGKQSYSLRLKRTLDRIGSQFFFYKKTPLPSGKTIISFALPDKISRVLTFGRAQSFWGAVLIRLGKTTIGKGLKKGAAWVLTRLGLAAIPSGVTQAIAIGLIAWDALKFVFKKLKEKPLQTLALGIGLFVLPILFPLLPAIGLVLAGLGLALGVIGFLAGAAKWAGGVISGVGNFLGGAASTMGGVLSSLGTISVPSTIPMVAAVGTPALVAGLTVVTILNTSAAFAPKEKGEIGEQPTTMGEPVAPRPPQEAGHLAENVIYALKNCGVDQVYEGTWEKAEECLRKSNLPSIETIIDQFKFSVFRVGPGLQCVGFVRGIMGALGRDPGGGRNARGYLELPTPANYYPINKNMKEVRVGDVVVMKGVIYGHMGIVVEREEKEGKIFIRVAQAWGNQNGKIEITRLESVNFNGFLRPHEK